MHRRPPSRRVAHAARAHADISHALFASLAQGRGCVNAWEESGDSCTQEWQASCDYNFADDGTSDALCLCETGETPSPSVTPSPTPLTCGVVYEGTDDASIGEGWSDAGVTYASGYGYIHGSCESHNNNYYYYSSGYYSSGNCVDTNNGAISEYDYFGCSASDGATYGAIGEYSGGYYCGSFDDSDFTSSEMCCGCGGGDYPPGDDVDSCGFFGHYDDDNYYYYGEADPVSKTFSLPPHHSVSVSMRVWKDGTFDDWEHIEITADGATVWTSEELEHSCVTGWTNMVLPEISCHDDSYLCYIDVELVIEHTASTLTIGFTLNGDEGCENESVGFSEFKLDIVPEGGTCAPTFAPTVSAAPSLTLAPSVTVAPTDPVWFKGEITCGSRITADNSMAPDVSGHDGPEHVWEYYAETNGTVRISTCGSQFDT